MALDLQKLLSDLPEDPNWALIAIASRLQNQKFVFDYQDQVSALTTLETFVRRNKVSITLRSDALYPKEKLENYVAMILGGFQEARTRERVATEVLQALEFTETVKTKENFGYAILSEPEKKDIHGHLARIREIVGGSSLSDRKKNALFGQLNDLVKEVDRNGTRTDRFFVFVGDLAFVLGDFAEKAKPLLRETKEMLRIVMDNRASTEQVSLPGGNDYLRLPPPE